MHTAIPASLSPWSATTFDACWASSRQYFNMFYNGDEEERLSKFL